MSAMSNPKPVEGALRDLADELNQCLQIIVTNAGNIKSCVDGAERRAAGQIEKAVDRATKATRKLAALSAAPAPICPYDEAQCEYPRCLSADPECVKRRGVAPARDGVLESLASEVAARNSWRTPLLCFMEDSRERRKECQCVRCGDCEGSGQVEVPTNGYPETDLEQCAMCRGTGIIEICEDCLDLPEEQI